MRLVWSGPILGILASWFSNASLHGAYICNASLQLAQLEGAQLLGTFLIGTNFQAANLAEAKLQGALHDHLDKPIEREPPDDSGAITEPPYTQQDAERWIAEYEEAVSAGPGKGER